MHVEAAAGEGLEGAGGLSTASSSITRIEWVTGAFMGFLRRQAQARKIAGVPALPRLALDADPPAVAFEDGLADGEAEAGAAAAIGPAAEEGHEDQGLLLDRNAGPAVAHREAMEVIPRRRHVVMRRYRAWVQRVLKQAEAHQYQNLDDLVITTPENTYGLHMPHVYLVAPIQTNITLMR